MTPLVPRIEVANFLKVHVKTLDRWARVGLLGVRLRRQKVGRSVRFSWADVHAFLKVVEQRGGKVK